MSRLGGASDGSTARQQTGGPGTTEIAGDSGIGTWWPTAQTSASTRNWKSISTIVCMRMPAEPPEVSPKVMWMASPSRRKPPMTCAVSTFQRGRGAPCAA